MRISRFPHYKRRTPGRYPLPVFILTLPPRRRDGTFANWLVGLPENSERAEQDRSNKNERGECCQHIQPQGKVHGRPPSLLNIVRTIPKSKAGPKRITCCGAEEPSQQIASARRLCGQVICNDRRLVPRAGVRTSRPLCTRWYPAVVSDPLFVLCNRAFGKQRGLKRGAISSETPDDLHAERHAARIVQARHVDAGRAHQRPEQVEACDAGRPDAMRG